MQAHFAAEREAVRQLPRLWSLKQGFALEEEPDQEQPNMIHLSAMHVAGTPPNMTIPPDGTHIRLRTAYFPEVSPDCPAEATGEQSPF